RGGAARAGGERIGRESSAARSTKTILFRRQRHAANAAHARIEQAKKTLAKLAEECHENLERERGSDRNIVAATKKIDRTASLGRLRRSCADDHPRGTDPGVEGGS